MKKKRMFIFFIKGHFLNIFCGSRCPYCICFSVYDSQLGGRGTGTWALGVFCCVSVCEWVRVVISAADHVFQASDEAKQLWQRARFISGTGAQNKEKMIDWTMNYLEVESRGTNQPCWGGKRGSQERDGDTPASLYHSLGPGRRRDRRVKNLPLIVLMRVTANLPK